MTVHRLALRKEKPGFLTLDRVIVVMFAACAVGFGFGWLEPDRFTITGFALIVALSALADDMAARQEHRDWMRLVVNKR